MTLRTVHDAEDLVTVLKVKVEDSRRALQLLRLQLREEKKEVNNLKFHSSKYCTQFSWVSLTLTRRDLTHFETVITQLK